MDFWKKIDEREDEVFQHIMENREKRKIEQMKKEQEAQKSQVRNPTSGGNFTVTNPVPQNRTAPMQNQNSQMQQKTVM